MYEIMTEDGDIITCKARGIFRHEHIKLMVGDSVTVENDTETEGSLSVSDIDKRKNALIRPPVSNLDNIIVTVACSEPEPILSTIDKLISIAEFNHINPCVVITKSELNEESAAHIKSIYEKSGFDTFITSSKKNLGITELKTYIKNKCSSGITAFAGTSGVGKSSIINALFPQLHLETGELSQKISRGKHTTRHVQLYPLKDIGIPEASGFLADTPGFSLIDFIRYDFYSKEDLPYTFREFKQYLGTCRYTKCTHTKEEGCSVIEAVKNGVIPPERHISFCEIYDEIKDKKPWDKK